MGRLHGHVMGWPPSGHPTSGQGNEGAGNVLPHSTEGSGECSGQSGLGERCHPGFSSGPARTWGTRGSGAPAVSGPCEVLECVLGPRVRG